MVTERGGVVRRRTWGLAVLGAVIAIAGLVVGMLLLSNMAGADDRQKACTDQDGQWVVLDGQEICFAPGVTIKL
jgi:hypothetical protein